MLPGIEPGLPIGTVAIVATTLYKNWYPGKLQDISHTEKVRGDLTLQSVAAALSRGYRVVISDGDSNEKFLEELSRTGVEAIPRKSKDRGAGRREGLAAASEIPGVKVLVRTEPEKVSLIEGCVPQMVKPILTGESDLVIAKREEGRFLESYPGYMRDSELRANAVYNRLLRQYCLLPMDSPDLDLFFAPMAIGNNPELLSLFKEQYKFTAPRIYGARKHVNPENWSNGQFFPVVAALDQEYRVESVEVPFVYPSLQKQNEESGNVAVFIQKRHEQRFAITDELIHFIRLLKGDKKGRLSLISRSGN